jgi:hypothetical protein
MGEAREDSRDLGHPNGRSTISACSRYAVLEQATRLPDKIKKIQYALGNSVFIANEKRDAAGCMALWLSRGRVITR